MQGLSAHCLLIRRATPFRPDS